MPRRLFRNVACCLAACLALAGCQEPPARAAMAPVSQPASTPTPETASAPGPPCQAQAITAAAESSRPTDTSAARCRLDRDTSTAAPSAMAPTR